MELEEKGREEKLQRRQQQHLKCHLQRPSSGSPAHHDARLRATLHTSSRSLTSEPRSASPAATASPAPCMFALICKKRIQEAGSSTLCSSPAPPTHTHTHRSTSFHFLILIRLAAFPVAHRPTHLCADPARAPWVFGSGADKCLVAATLLSYRAISTSKSRLSILREQLISLASAAAAAKRFTASKPTAGGCTCAATARPLGGSVRGCRSSGGSLGYRRSA